MNMKYLFSSILSFMICISALAQNNRGVDYYSLGENKLAKETFLKSVQQEPDLSYYYLGEIALNEGKPDEAKANYEKGIAVNPQSIYCAIGLAKLNYKSDPKELSKALKDIQKTAKKDISVLLQIANAYYQSGMPEDGAKMLDEARKVDKKSPLIYICEGDMYAKANKIGEAAAQYDQAINFDPSFVLAYIKGAKVYETISPSTASSMLKKVLEIDPNYAIANKYLAELSYHTGFYPQAIESYKAYFAGGDYTITDMVRYAGSLYFNKNYDEAKKAINEGLAKDPNNRILYRLLMYSNNDTKDYDAAEMAAEKFFSLPLETDTTKYLVQDYTTYANILKEKNDISKALDEYEKAIKMDPEKVSIYKDIASTLSKEGKYMEAGDIYQKYIDVQGDKAENGDYLQMGSYYYRGGSIIARSLAELKKAQTAGNTNLNDSIANTQSELQKFVSKADTAFAKLVNMMPDSYLGYYWRANVNSLIDQDLSKGLANPYYEKVIEIITKDADQKDNQKPVIEAYRYFAIYYLYQFDAKKKTEDKDNAKMYAEKLLEIAPDDATGKQILDYMNK